MFVQNSLELTEEFFIDLLNGNHLEYNKSMYQHKKLNVLIPMAGRVLVLQTKVMFFQNPW